MSKKYMKNGPVIFFEIGSSAHPALLLPGRALTNVDPLYFCLFFFCHTLLIMFFSVLSCTLKPDWEKASLTSFFFFFWFCQMNCKILAKVLSTE